MAYLLSIIGFGIATTVTGTAKSKRVRVLGEVAMGIFLAGTIISGLVLVGR